ncbi:fungal-specific transcription factor domain-containing protein [Xylariaceae sp. FL0662B]|nr:fungal-specific transcription factor domain-containing protein [Xylariaceae sp. FL0662B]
MGAAESSPTDSGRQAYLGRSSAAAFMKELQESSSRPKRSGVATEDAASSTTSKTSYLKSRKEQDELNAFFDELVLPPRRVSDAYLDRYWQIVHPLYPIPHRSTFMDRYEKTLTHDLTSSPGYRSDSGMGDVHAIRAFYATFNIMLALGCAFASPTGPTSSSGKSAEQFFERSQKLLRDCNVEHASMQNIQALALTGLYLQSTDLVNRCWTTVGHAIRLGQGIGVHLDLDTESQAERQERIEVNNGIPWEPEHFPWEFFLSYGIPD